MLTLYVVVAWAGKAETFCNNVSLFLSSSDLGKMAHNHRTILRHLSRSKHIRAMQKEKLFKPKVKIACKRVLIRIFFFVDQTSSYAEKL